MTSMSLRHIAGVCAVVQLAMVSCVLDISKNPNGPDNPDPVSDENVEMAINVPLPDMFESVLTRALTHEQESTVGELDVLVFEQNGGLIEIVGAVKRSTSTFPVQQFDITVPRAKVAGKTIDVVALANSSNAISKALGTNPDRFDGLRYDDLVAKFTTPVTGTMYTATNSTIPMWGESRGIKVTESDKTQITIKLVRAVARVDIGVGQVSKLTDTDYRLAWNGLDDNGKVIPFVPTEIYIARPGSVISLLPSRANMNSESKIVTPTIHVDNELFPAGKSWTKFAYTFGGKKFSTQEIYIP